MRALILATCLFAAAYGLNTALDLAAFEPANCQCDCNCHFEAETPCRTDFYVLLDAASCVRNAWDEMRLRVNLVARSLNNDHVMNGRLTRFSVMRFAKKGHLDIPITDNLDFASFSKELDKLETFNQGSFLNEGLMTLQKHMRETKVQGRRQVAIIITNGNSHPDANVRAQTIKDINAMVNRQLYINTIIPIKDASQENTFDEECIACKWNHELFVEQAGLDRVKQIISKDRIEEAITREIAELCYVEKVNQVCTECTCKCRAPNGPVGEIGPIGPNGPSGPDGQDGVDGIPGKDGGSGIDGPAGGDGCDGAHGSPGHHGKPGWEGDAGSMGGVGIMGMEGPVGAPGRGQGEPGLDGPDGPAGAAGAPGRDGQDGQPGPNGMNGMRGAQGPAGSPGAPGDKGRCGDAGRPGQSGKQGLNGVNGANGEQGRVGDKGRQGFPGKQGPAGATGSQGQAGRNGRDGQPGGPGSKGMPGATGERGGMNARNSDMEGFVRQKVRSMLDRMLDDSSRGSGMRHEFFCKCKAFNLYDVVVAGLSLN